MPPEQKEELKSNGFVIIEKLHVTIMTLIAVLVFVGSLFGLYAYAVSEKEQIKNKVEVHEARIQKIEQILESFDTNQLEIKLNLKSVVEKVGAKYQTVE